MGFRLLFAVPLGIQPGQTRVDSGNGLMRFTLAVHGGILSLNQDSIVGSPTVNANVARELLISHEGII